MSESIQHKLDRVRPPRVHITYDVEVGDAIEKKELPFVVGILADLSGNPEEALPRIKERKFVEIDRDNFNEVLAACKPRLAFRVENKITEDDEEDMMNVALHFNHLDDFSPTSVVNQIDPLRELLETRTRLKDVIAKLDGNDDLDELLQHVIQNAGAQEELRAHLGGNNE